ncbi:MAG: LysM peptidoglycan-binding domain-containing protein [Cyanothece sp. SIO1E1]|nr:LysM peptidoglycan-binding domain-containing protein [Cyanothece sp. SIO1E1]
MERLEYQSPNKSVDPFVAYQINVGDGEKVILEIGQESRNTTSKLPTPTVGCDNGVFNLSMVQKINAHIDEVFLVVKKNNRRYTVSPVNFATHFMVKEDVVSVYSPKYKFEFNTKEGAIGENISRESTADVFFEGRLEKECTGAYVFRQIAQGSRTPYTDLVLIPEVGIIEMRSGQTLDQALTNGMQLTKVNDDKFDDYLEEKCEESLSDNVLANTKPGQSGGTEVTPSGPIGYDMTVKQGNVRQRNNNTVNTRPNTTPIPQSANQVGGTNQYHIVKKGETLYRISKQYNITVGQIKAWNNLNSNLIKTGSQLMVGTVAPTANNSANNVASTVPNTVSNSNNPVANTNSQKPRYYPAPYNTTYRPNNTVENPASNEVFTARGGQNSYIVKPGDTVASLAMRFGYTESKFRTINNLGSNDYVKIGQELKTNDCNCPTQTSSYPNTTTEVPQEFNVVQQETPIESTNNFGTQNPVQNPTTERRYPVNFNDTPIQTTSSTPYIPQNEEAFRNSTSSPSPLYSPRGVQTGNTNANSSLFETERSTNNSSRQPSPYDAIIPSSFDTYSPITTGEKEQATRGVDLNRTNANRRQHVVQDGENIFQIARMYNITTERLRALNGLELGEVIIPTQKLYVE